jgi:hypothetical protein
MKRNTPARNYVMLLLLLLFSGIMHVQAQTTLATGDISFIGFNSTIVARDGFAFVPWVDLQAGTVIKFTDDSYNSAASATSAGNIRDQEQLVTWTASTAVAAGTVIKIEGNAIDPTMVANTGTVTVTNANGTSTSSLVLSSTDEIFAFQGGSFITSNSTTGTMASNTVMPPDLLQLVTVTCLRNFLPITCF